jgi:UDP-glucose:(heptosyl)LPS alpha-1,3-glucosyltransferase
VDLAAFHPGLRIHHRDRVRTELGIEPHVPALLFFGGAWRMKGWPLLLDALARLRDRRWVLVAAGERPAAAARAAASEGLGDRVRVLPPQDPRPLYAAADLFVQPTWRDPCSLATLEALACGLPVVTTDANGAADALGGAGAEAGEAVPAGDANAFARALGLRLHVLAHASEAARRAAERRPREAWLAGLLASARAVAATSRP